MKRLLLTALVFTTLNTLADTYSCQVVGKFKNMDGQVSSVDVSDLIVEVGDEGVSFGRLEAPSHDFDVRPETMPWTLKIKERKDRPGYPIILSLNAPNQNGTVGLAFAQKGSKYIGFVSNSTLEAVCIKQ